MNKLLTINNHHEDGKLSTPAYTKVLPKISSLVLVVSLVAGCSGGGGSGGDSGSNAFAADPVVPDPIVTDPVVPDPIVTDPVVPDPIVSDPVVPDPIVSDPVVPDPIVSTPVVPLTNPTESPLSQLFGRAIFVFGFSGSETLFIFDGMFGPEDLVGDVFDDLSLLDSVDTFVRLDADSEFSPLESESMVCSFAEGSQQFLCTVLFDSGATDVFLFDSLVDNESFGSFTFCVAGLSSADCIDELVNFPDGDVLVSVDGSAMANLINLAKLDASKNSPRGGSIVPYLGYEDQGTPGAIADRSSVSAEVDAFLLDAFEKNKSNARTLD